MNLNKKTIQFSATFLSHGNNKNKKTNKLEQFSCDLPNVNLSDYEVALQSISLPRIASIGDVFYLKYKRYEAVLQPQAENESSFYKIKIQLMENIKTVDDVLQQVSINLETKSGLAAMFSLKKNEKNIWTLDSAYTGLYIIMNRLAMQILQVNDPEIFLGSKTSYQFPNVNHNRKILRNPPLGYIYCSILQNVLTANNNKTLLQVVPMKNFYGANELNSKFAIMYEPSNLIYHNIVNQSINKIEFCIKDAKGKIYSFLPSTYLNYNDTIGGCIINLHFRSKRITTYTFTSKISFNYGIARKPPPKRSYNSVIPVKKRKENEMREIHIFSDTESIE